MRGRPVVRVRGGTVGGEGPAAWVFNYEDTDSVLATGTLEAGEYRCVLTGRKVAGGEEIRLARREVLFLVPENY